MKTIQINTCTQEELDGLPGVGPATARKIIEARPIKDVKELETVIPPSAWLKSQEAGVEFGFDIVPDGVNKVPQEKSPLVTTGPVFIPQSPVVLLTASQPMTLRRVMPGQSLRQGASYLCVWNMKWGPGGEAYAPTDAPTQAEIEVWFKAHNMDIQFAHYGASVRVGTKNKGHVPLVLFEIIPEEKQDGNGKEAGNNEGNS